MGKRVGLGGFGRREDAYLIGEIPLFTLYIIPFCGFPFVAFINGVVIGHYAKWSWSLSLDECWKASIDSCAALNCDWIQTHSYFNAQLVDYARKMIIWDSQLQLESELRTPIDIWI